MRKNKDNNHGLQRPIHAKCKKHVLFLPLILWSVYIGCLLFNPRIPDYYAHILTYGFLFVSFFAITVNVFLLAYTELEVSDSGLTIWFMGKYERHFDFQ